MCTEVKNVDYGAEDRKSSRKSEQRKRSMGENRSTPVLLEPYPPRQGAEPYRPRPGRRDRARDELQMRIGEKQGWMDRMCRWLRMTFRMAHQAQMMRRWR